MSDDFRMTVFYSLEDTGLHIAYRLDAPLADLIIPGVDRPSNGRMDRLWEHTCFELFLGSDNSSGYREFNLSPSGAWNVYSFTGYRSGMKPEPLFKTLPFDVGTVTDSRLELSLSIDPAFISGASNTLIGLSAVLAHVSGEKSFWALSHPGSTPDFHNRKSWQRPL